MVGLEGGGLDFFSLEGSAFSGGVEMLGRVLEVEHNRGLAR